MEEIERFSKLYAARSVEEVQVIGTSDYGKECKFIFCCRLKGQGVTEAEKLLKLRLLSYNRRDWNSGGGDGYATQYGVVMEG